MGKVVIEEVQPKLLYRENAKPRRVFYVAVGDLKPRDVQPFLEGVKAAMEAIDEWENK